MSRSLSRRVSWAFSFVSRRSLSRRGTEGTEFSEAEQGSSNFLCLCVIFTCIFVAGVLALLIYLIVGTDLLRRQKEDKKVVD
ncbi:unnamed protein product [Vitrella brassicaformis CCMP3155]|uniref:Uncharacterized protein n=1 Tax=Vitrella brassicaformis (strain CCMP3155) TaxID=1169540 RepID=A0A0G4G9K9_VITBC|nr:unnamed protein product [Vitrella brassicaformis CCMP3155]|eukprot:CEM25701.1 unnamed protein product [Vitrella brassicaformis CCMP3155]